MQYLTTNMDTVYIATEDGPNVPRSIDGGMADVVTRLKCGGIRWEPAPGVIVEHLTPNTRGVRSADKTPLHWRTTLGPEVLWRSSWAHLVGVMRWLTSGDRRVMGVHVAADYFYRPADGNHTDRPDPRFPRALRGAFGDARNTSEHWTKLRRARLSQLVNGLPTCGFSFYRGKRNKGVQDVLYHKTARSAECSAACPTYMSVWAAHGYPVSYLACDTCGECIRHTRGLLWSKHSCSGKGTLRLPTVLRRETRWGARETKHLSIDDLGLASAWPTRRRCWDGTPFQPHSVTTPFKPPRQRRDAATVATLLQHHADMATHHRARVAFLQHLEVGKGAPDMDDQAAINRALCEVTVEVQGQRVMLHDARAVLESAKRESWSARLLRQRLALVLGFHDLYKADE